MRDHSISEECLERIGIIGISLMASLAGFAAVSSLWQTFGVKYKPVCEIFLLSFKFLMLSHFSGGLFKMPHISSHCTDNSPGNRIRHSPKAIRP